MHRLTTLIITLFLALHAMAQQEEFCIQEIPDSIFARMQGKSWSEDCRIARSDLKYLKLLHVDENGKTHRGELICNKAIAVELLEIFRQLYRNRYPIHSVRLIDEYAGNDELSMRANNTSCFNYRKTSRGAISKHARGMAIDINPLWNPCVHITGRKAGTIEPSTAKRYANRQKTADDSVNIKKINRNDLCYKLLTKHGFRWGGNWRSMKDYQHFEK